MFTYFTKANFEGPNRQTSQFETFCLWEPVLIKKPKPDYNSPTLIIQRKRLQSSQALARKLAKTRYLVFDPGARWCDPFEAMEGVPWGKFVTEAPRPYSPPEQQYRDPNLRSRRRAGSYRPIPNRLRNGANSRRLMI